MLRCLLFLAVLLLIGCAPQPLAPSSGHLHSQSEPPPPVTTTIPPPVLNVPYVPPPPPQTSKTELFTVTVDQVPAKELLFALARDAKLDVDIDPRIKGVVSMSAINQTLPQLLDRIAKQLDLRYQLHNNQLSISLDLPYVQTYKVDYVNMSRDSESKIVTTQLSGKTNTLDNSSLGSNSQTSVTNISKNRFWETLEKNINAILLTEERLTITRRKQLKASTKTDEPSAAKTDTEEEKEEKVIQNNVMINPESGMISVRATSRQHSEIQKLLQKTSASIQRQVLVEATIVEVILNDQYQSGINWQRLGGKFNIIQHFTPINADTPPFYGLTYQDHNSANGDISIGVKLLETFGHTKVLSSPKVVTLNNQTAILKVVDNHVYFTTSVKETEGTSNSARRITYETIINTMPEGLTISITPQISDDDNVMLNVRPTITRIIGYKNDPNPALASAGITNQIPVSQIREIESLLKVRSGQIIVMGGLMQNTAKQQTDGLPMLSKLPLVGDLFSQRDDQYKKSELVIFLRPVVIKDAAIHGDFQQYRRYLPQLNVEPPPATNIISP